ncbi:MAG: YicC family protein [Candidatus Aminicenantes bacterium]|nr:YicC family protein [Candidatus Aminicenantes bacterium]
MTESMTGYAERSFTSRTMRAKVAVKSLNHRFFDWNYKGAPLGELENRLRTACQAKLHRGRVEVVIDLFFPDASSWEVEVNEGLLENILRSVDRVSSRLGTKVQFSVDNLFRIPQAVELRRKDFTPAETAFLGRSFDRTLDDVLRARRAEGVKVAAQLASHLRTIGKAVGRVERRLARQPKIVRQKVRARLTEVNGVKPASKERLAEEVAYLTQRYDIVEEVARLKHHIGAARKLVTSKSAEPAGKMLDFLAQELTREANTLNSKSQDLGITREGLLIKGEVEAVRQQVQNIV